MKKAPEAPIKVGISTCLLGQKVRFDAGHKRDRYITDILGQYFQFVPVCPEVEVGMGVPRESVRLEGTVEAPRMVGNKTRRDWTERMNRYAEKRVRRRDLGDLSGYILKKDSPSCGLARVRVYGKTGMPDKRGVGLFGAALTRQHPLLPIEEEGRLNDNRLRENFIVRVFAWHHLQNFFTGNYSRGAMVKFHAAQKYLLLAHSSRHYRELGQLVAAVKKYSPAALREKYTALYMEGLGFKTTTRKNVNVLQHIFGFFKKSLEPGEKQDILSVIEDYRNELVPLIVPITLLRHYVNKFDVEYVRNQIYLNPHPRELMLRNHV